MTKRKDGLWQTEITIAIDGRKKRKCFYGKTKAEVYAKIANFRQGIETGRTFDEVAVDWWEETRPTLAVNTLRGYRPAVARARAEFAERPIRSLRASDFSSFLRTFVKEMDAADKTARTQLLVLRQICKYAVDNGEIESNPARDVSVPKGLKKETRSMPSDDDIKRVKDHIDAPFGLFAYLVLYTGCRRGEALALTWDDVDITNRCIYVTKSVYQDRNTPLLKSPKTEAGKRVVPLLDRLYAVLHPAEGLLFPDPKTGGLMTEMHFQRLWKAYATQSGVSCTPHQLRHAFATMLFEAGVSDKDAQDILGHSQISTTRDIYTHIRNQHRQKINAALLPIDI